MSNEPTLIVTPDLLPAPIVRIRGMNTRIYPDPRRSVEQAELLENMYLTERGTARRRKGYTTYNATQTAGTAWLGLIQETFSDGTELEIVVGDDAKIYTDDGTTRSDVTNTAEVSTSADDRVRHVLLNDTIYGTDGTKRPWTKGKSGNAAILTSNAQFAAASGDFCKDFVVHKNMLVALHTKESGTVFPTRIRWCDINPRTLVPDPTVWPTGNFAEIFYSGGAIVGGVDAFPGESRNTLMVAKTDGFYPCELNYDSGYIEADIGSAFRGISPLARHSLLARPDFVWCICREGAVRINRDMSVEVVTDSIQTEYQALNQGRLQYAKSWILEQEHQIYTLLSSSTNTTGHDRVLVYDWESGDVWINKITDVMNTASSIIIDNTQLAWYGDLDGYIYQGRVGNDNGSDIAFQVKMSQNDLGFPRRDKHLVNLRTYYRLASGSESVTVSVQLDEGRQPTVSGELDLGTALTWNSGLKWNAGLQYLGGATQTATFFVNRMAEVAAPKWTGTGDVEFIGYSFEHSLAE